MDTSDYQYLMMMCYHNRRDDVDDTELRQLEKDVNDAGLDASVKVAGDEEKKQKA